MQPPIYRISNESWAYSELDLFEGEIDLMTPQEYYEMQSWNAMCDRMNRIESSYGERHDLVAWETEREENRTAWALPAAWIA